MRKKYRIIIGAGLLCSFFLIGIVFYIKSITPPGEEWIAYQNKDLIASIDFQLQDLNMEHVIKDKEQYILEKSIPELQEAVKRGELTYEEITAIYLYRIKTFDQRKHGFNSVMEIAPDAVEQARARDHERMNASAKDKFPPLFGIPVMLKDNINTANMPTSAGAVALADFKPKDDAELVHLLREQGAVILGKNNLSEFAYYVSSVMPSGYSGKKGQTVNPFGPLKLSPSGSSSGSAVAVTANLVPISIGTETAGSIVGPASVNSVVGFKPTRDTVSGEGILPLIKKIDTAGPIAKNVRDAALSYEVISGKKVSLKSDDSALNNAVIGLITFEYNDETMIQNLKTALQNAGAGVVEVQLDSSGVQVQNIIELTFKQDFEEFALQYGLPVKNLSDLIEFNKKEPGRRARYGQDYLEAANAVKQSDYLKIEDSISNAKASLDTLFEKHGLDAVVFLQTSASDVMSAAGYPELSIPFGLSSKKAPTGITFGGRYGEDEKLLNIGNAFEQAVGKRIIPDTAGISTSK